MVILGHKILHSIPELPRNVVAKVTENNLLPFSGCNAIKVESYPETINSKAIFYITNNESVFHQLKDQGVSAVFVPEVLKHIGEGDIIRVSPSDNHLRVLFKKSHRQNAFLLTERCNNWCIMCSQPPRDIDDSYIVDDVLNAIYHW